MRPALPPAGAGRADAPRRAAAPGPEAAEEFDALAAVAALFEERAGAAPTGPGGLAAGLLEFLTPRPRFPDAFAPSRLLGLLEVAAAEAARLDGGREGDEGLGLAAAALRDELELHRAVAERRGGLLDT